MSWDALKEQGKGDQRIRRTVHLWVRAPPWLIRDTGRDTSMLRAQGIDAFRQGSRMSIGALDGPAACAVDALRARYKWIRFDHDGDSEPAGDYHYHCSDTGSDSHR